MSDYYEEDSGGANIYAWMIYLSAAFFFIALILKWMQLDLYALR